MTAHVTTFYSFKGGVGRTLLMVNVGALLAQRGRRVLLWDLDLEAPGLHHIKALEIPPARRGFLDWLAAWQGGDGQLTEARRKDLVGLVQPVSTVANLSVLRAFGEADFAKLFVGVAWHEMLVERPEVGLQLFRGALDALASGFDHILIDSRTGLTDVGGLLTAALPHATVLIGSYGHQSVRGLSHVHKALMPAVEGRLPSKVRPDPLSQLSLVHVVSPVPADTADAAERRRVWGEVFGDLQPTEVPWDGRLLFVEHLAALDKNEDDPTRKAYALVAEQVAQLRKQALARLETMHAREPGLVELAVDRTRKGDVFEARVAQLLTLLGYEVEREQVIGGNRIDLLAVQRSGLDDQVWWVECKDHEQATGKDVLEKLQGWISGREGVTAGARGMVVARSFSPAALAYARDHASLRVYTADELERRLFDPTPYLQGLKTSWEQSELARTWVRQRLLLEAQPRDPEGVDLLEHALAWARGEGQRFWLVLGDYGTGKSTFFKRLAYELAQKHLDDPEQPFPIAIDLKEFPNAISIEMLLTEHLRAKLPGFRGSPETVLHLLGSGRAVLLLDAFDEMGIATAGRSIEDQFRQLAQVTSPSPLHRRGNRMLLTCRTHFFRDQQQVKDAAEGAIVGIKASGDSALGKLARRFTATIDELLLFNDAQIDAFLVHHLGTEEAKKARKTIQETYDLTSLAPRPVLLDMIVKSLPKLVEAGGEVTPAGLYDVYTRQWLEDTSGRSLQTRPELRHRLLTLLADVLWTKEDQRIHHSDLLAEVRQHERLFPGLDHERVDLELRTAAFLVRSADGYYRFSHKSFLEFFFAMRLSDSIEQREWETLERGGETLRKEVAEFLHDLVDYPHQLADTLLDELLADGPSTRGQRVTPIVVALSDMESGTEAAALLALSPPGERKERIFDTTGRFYLLDSLCAGQLLAAACRLDWDPARVLEGAWRLDGWGRRPPPTLLPTRQEVLATDLLLLSQGLDGKPPWVDHVCAGHVLAAAERLDRSTADVTSRVQRFVGLGLPIDYDPVALDAVPRDRNTLRLLSRDANGDPPWLTGKVHLGLLLHMAVQMDLQPSEVAHHLESLARAAELELMFNSSLLDGLEALPDDARLLSSDPGIAPNDQWWMFFGWLEGTVQVADVMRVAVALARPLESTALRMAALAPIANLDLRFDPKDLQGWQPQHDDLLLLSSGLDSAPPWVQGTASAAHVLRAAAKLNRSASAIVQRLAALGRLANFELAREVGSFDALGELDRDDLRLLSWGADGNPPWIVKVSVGAVLQGALALGWSPLDVALRLRLLAEHGGPPLDFDVERLRDFSLHEDDAHLLSVGVRGPPWLRGEVPATHVLVAAWRLRRKPVEVAERLRILAPLADLQLAFAPEQFAGLELRQADVLLLSLDRDGDFPWISSPPTVREVLCTAAELNQPVEVIAERFVLLCGVLGYPVTVDMAALQALDVQPSDHQLLSCALDGAGPWVELATPEHIDAACEALRLPHEVIVARLGELGVPVPSPPELASSRRLWGQRRRLRTRPGIIG